MGLIVGSCAEPEYGAGRGLGAIAFNPSNDLMGQSVALKASDWGCFPRISPLLNQVELWQFNPGAVIDSGHETRENAEGA
jgi:hypothetical protein